MSFISSWLGTDKPRRTEGKAAGRITVAAPGFRPSLEALELRAMPDATIVTRQPDYTSQTDLLDVPGDAAVQVLGASGNGRYLLLQSKATNLARIVDASGVVRPQVSAPGQTNLFWLERRDDGTNNIVLISAYDPAPAFDAQFVPGQKGLGVAESVPGKFLNSVISDDGKSVVFLSGANAALFDSNVYITAGFGVDSGGQDAFVWRQSTGRVSLVSKTSRGTAIGGSGGVTSPSISPDGKVVTFVSDFNAQNIAGRGTGDAGGGVKFVLFIDNNNSPDLFRVDTTVATSVPEPVSVLRITRPPLPVDTQDLQFVMMGASGTTEGMVVDPLGRYVTAGGAGFVALHRSPVSANLDAFRFTYDTLVGPPANDNSPYTIDTSNIDFSGSIFGFGGFGGQVASNLLPAIVNPGAGGFFGIPTLETAVDAGSVLINNAIVTLFNADVVLVYRQVAPITNKSQVVIPGYTGSATASGNDQFDLVQRGFIGGKVQTRLLTRQAGSTTQGVGFLDLTPGAYSVTPDAIKFLFTSSAPAGQFVSDPVQLSAGAIVDTNKQFDIFQFDGSSNNFTSLVSVRNSTANATGLGSSTLPTMTPDGIAIAFQSTVLSDELSNTPDLNGAQSDIFVRDIVQRQTILASAVPGSISSGNGASVTSVVVRSAQANREFFRNFEVLFTSAATNLDPQVPVDPANPQVFSAKFPVFISGLPRAISFSGGEGGFVTIARTDNLGNLIATSKIQPFAGYTGEIRVATADFNGDGVPDVAVAAGPGGGPRVSIIDGFTLRTIDNFFAFESSFTGGVYVAAGDLNNSGLPELIIGAGEGGGPRLQVYNVATGVRTFDQFAYESTSRTGVRVAVGDFNGDGTNDIFIGAGAGGAPRVRVLSGKTLPNQTVLADFFAFNSGDRNGVNISAGDFDADGKSDVVVGTGNGSTPRVIIYNAAYPFLSSPNASPFDAPAQNPLRVDQAVKFIDFQPFVPSDAVGARAVLRNIDGGKFAGILVSTGGQLPIIQSYSGSRRGTDALGNGLAPQLLKEQIPYDSLFGTFGAWVG
jgi:hypothetical protein